MSDISTEPGSSGPDTQQAAKDQAAEVKDTAAVAGKQVVGTAKDEVQNVAQEATSQGRQLAQQAGEQLAGQASNAQQTLASAVRSYSEELTSMVSSGEGSGPVSGLAQQAADRGHGIADFLESREPRDVLGEVQRFARQRPLAFLGIAAASGFLVGRLTRNLAADHAEQKDQPLGSETTPSGPRYAAPAVGSVGSVGPSSDELETVPARPSASLEELPDESTTDRDAVYDPVSETPVVAPATADPAPGPYQPGGGSIGGPR